eukprot:scaffold125798_cov36-Tisochrysis_lutea.AAC.1
MIPSCYSGACLARRTVQRTRHARFAVHKTAPDRVLITVVRDSARLASAGLGSGRPPWPI